MKSMTIKVHMITYTKSELMFAFSQRTKKYLRSFDVMIMK